MTDATDATLSNPEGPPQTSPPPPRAPNISKPISVVRPSADFYLHSFVDGNHLRFAMDHGGLDARGAFFIFAEDPHDFGGKFAGRRFRGGRGDVATGRALIWRIRPVIAGRFWKIVLARRIVRLGGDQRRDRRDCRARHLSFRPFGDSWNGIASLGGILGRVFHYGRAVRGIRLPGICAIHTRSGSSRLASARAAL